MKNKNKNWYKVAQSSSLDLSEMKLDTIASIRKYETSKKSQDKNQAQMKIAMYQNSANNAGDNGHIKTASLLTQRLYQAMAGKISAKSMKQQAVMKQAKLRDWVLPGMMGAAGLMGAGQAKGDYYDGTTSGKTVTPTSVNQIDYDQSKLTPQQKGQLNQFKRHDNADNQNNRKFIQQKIQFLQAQKKARNSTIVKVKAKITQATKAGKLEDAMAYKNYLQKSLMPEINALDSQIAELRGQSNPDQQQKQKVQENLNGKFKINDGRILSINNSSASLSSGVKGVFKQSENSIYWQNGIVWKILSNKNMIEQTRKDGKKDILLYSK